MLVSPIEKGVSIPAHRRTLYGFERMEVGDSRIVFIGGNWPPEVRNRVAASAGMTEETVGAVVSLLVPDTPPSSPHETSMGTARTSRMRYFLNTFVTSVWVVGGSPPLEFVAGNVHPRLQI